MGAKSGCRSPDAWVCREQRKELDGRGWEPRQLGSQPALVGSKERKGYRHPRHLGSLPHLQPLCSSSSLGMCQKRGHCGWQVGEMGAAFSGAPKTQTCSAPLPWTAEKAELPQLRWFGGDLCGTGGLGGPQ